MKEALKLIFTFLLLCVAISVWSSCTSKSTEQGNGTSAEPGNEPRSSKSSEYPPLPAAVAQAEIKNLDGSTFKITDKKGKVLLLNMWATWCGPCRGEMPSLIALQDKHRDKGFEILGLDTDDEKVEDINKFADEMKLNYTLVWADNETQNALVNISKFGGIPQSFLVDRDGHLRGVFKGGGKSEVQKLSDLVDSVVNE